MEDIARTTLVPVSLNWKMTAFYRGTKEVAVVRRGHNMFVTAGLTHVGNKMIDAVGWNNGFTYCAIGTGNAAPAMGDVALDNEVYRQVLTSKANIAGVVTLVCYMSYADCTFNIKEAGIFGHDAGAAPDSGSLDSRWLVSFDNSAGYYDIQWEYEVTFG